MENFIILSSQKQQEELCRQISFIVEERLKNFQPQIVSNIGYLTRKEVSKLLRISLPTLHDYTKNGIIEGYRIGGRVLYKTAEIEKAVAGLSTIKYRHVK